MDPIIGPIYMDEVEHRRTAMPWHGNRTGYGPRQPTSHMVRLPGDARWRRVYCAIWGNAGTCYIMVRGQRIIVY